MKTMKIFLFFAFLIAEHCAFAQESLSFPLPIQIIGSSQSSYVLNSPNEGNILLNFDGWNQATFRLRFSPDLDLSLFKYLSIEFEIQNIQGNAEEDFFKVFFYDQNWTSGISKQLDFSSQILLNQKQMIQIPLPDFKNANFNSSSVRDMTFEIWGSGPIQSSMILYSIQASGGPSESFQMIGSSLDGVGNAIQIISQKVVEVIVDGHVNMNEMMKPESWSMSSVEDVFWINPIHPDAVGRFSSTLDGNINWSNPSYEDIVLRHKFYLQFNQPFQLDQHYQLVLNPIVFIPESILNDTDYKVTIDSNGDAIISNVGGNETSQIYYWLTPESYWPYKTSLEGTWSIDLPEQSEWSFIFGQNNGLSRAIKINQHAYSLQSQQRYIYIGYWLGSLGALELDPFLEYKIFRISNSVKANQTFYVSKDLEPVQQGQISYRIITESSLQDPFLNSNYDYVFSGEKVFDIDISGLTKGSYYVEIDSIGRSDPFRIGGGAFESFYTTSRALYHQRCSLELTDMYTPWSRAACHLNVFDPSNDAFDNTYENWGQFFPQSTPQLNSRTIVGGWHDAGDFDRRPLHLQTVGHLAMLDEMFLGKFVDILNIPESSNGISDILDEAYYGFQLWEQIQDISGAVRSGVESSSHPSGGRSDQDLMNYWVYSANRWTSYGYAARAAQLSRLFLFYSQPEKAQIILENGMKAFDWAESQEYLGTTSPVDNTDEAKAIDIAQARLSALGELYATTGNIIYQNGFQEIWNCIQGLDPIDKGDCTNLKYSIDWTNVDMLWGMSIADHENLNVSLQNEVRERIFFLANEYLKNIDQNRYRNSRPPHHNIAWGTGSSVSRYSIAMMMAYYLNPDPSYINGVSLNKDFLIGTHPHGVSWITGLGIHDPKNPLHLDSMYDLLNTPVPGIPIYGAFPSYCNDAESTYWKCLVYNSFFPETYNLDASPSVPLIPIIIPDSRHFLPPIQYYSQWTGMAPMNEFTVWDSMNMTILSSGFLFGVSDESSADLSGLTVNDYPLNPGKMVFFNDEEEDSPPQSDPNPQKEPIEPNDDGSENTTDSNLFLNQNIKAKCRKNHYDHLALDGDLETSFKPKKRNKTKIKISLSSQSFLQSMRLYIQLNHKNPVHLKFKVSFFDHNQKINKMIFYHELDESQWVDVGNHLNKTCDQVKIIIMNQKINKNQKPSRYSIVEIESY